ncbi:uncharacterized protein LOC124452149 [Xenia sp. Carnegie-2017]|uniref:uncharacterized protein LOC124452149 n=1 Tax=Xenia sp. Carnegie-2017 TaxID=2897299 RepID=UPI001F0437EC|nr:uncharacterized protein LOC124452149 [Xenia sp. Carnegie-2017]
MEDIIRNYFTKNYTYDTILQLLQKYHGIRISRSTLLNKLKLYGLQRRGNTVDKDHVRRCIVRELDGSGKLLGYRAMWRRLQSKYGLQVPRLVAQTTLQEVDPEGSKWRRANRLRRRAYMNPGPNYCWHADGYDKLKPYGFPIHGCIDGFSRKILWLNIVPSNNDPRVVGRLFYDCISNMQLCPKILRTDRGTENGIMASAQCFLRRDGTDTHSDVNAHQYGSSHSNQRIEAWWAMLRRSWASWWMNFFKDLIAKGVLDTSNVLQLECLWFCFSPVLKKGLDQIKESWNSHYVRKSRFYTHAGIPDQLYLLPEAVGAEDFQKQYDDEDLIEIYNSVNVSTEKVSTYQKYFSYSAGVLQIGQIQTWREALMAYERLLEAA